MKKIIIAVFAFAVFFFVGQNAFASNVFNGQPGDCNPAVGIGVYPNIQRDSNGCWTQTSITANPGDVINIAMYYHNNTSSTIPNVRGSITKTSSGPQDFTFTGRIYSSYGTQTIGTVHLHLTSPQAVTYSSTHWMRDADAVLSDTDTQVFHNSDGSQISFGNVYSDYGNSEWEYFGELLAVYNVGTNVIIEQPEECSITSFKANGNSSVSIDAGESANLSWNTDHCVSASISPSVGSVSVGGNESVSPSNDTTYILTAHGVSYSQSVQASVHVNVNSSNNNNDEPDATTNNSYDVTEDSAELRGSVDMNDFDNGLVFFVYGQDENQIEDIENDYNTYNSVDEDGEDLQKESVDSDLDGSDSYTLDVSGLDSDENYYYSICVQYEDNSGDYDLICGSVKNFTTDDDNNDNNNNNNNNDDACEISQFTSNRTSVGDGTSATLSWNTNGCDSVYISGIGNVNASGSRAVYPSDTTTYTLSAYDSNGNTDTARVTISVTGVAYQGACGITSTASGVTKTSATLNGITAGPSSSSTYFEYGPTSSLGQRTSARNVSGGSSFNETIYGLNPGTTYYFRLVSNCESGNKFGSLSTLRTASDTVPAYVPPVVHTTNTTTVVGSGSPIMLKIENRFEFVKRGDTINYTITYKNIGKTTLKNSLIQVIVPEGIEMTNVSLGSYSNVNHILNVPLGNLVKNAEGEIYLDAKINSIIAEKLVSTATLVYTNPNGAQENAIAYVINIPKGGASSLGAASLFAGILSMNLFGWLLLILLVLIIILLIKKYFSKKEKKYTPSY